MTDAKAIADAFARHGYIAEDSFAIAMELAIALEKR